MCIFITIFFVFSVIATSVNAANEETSDEASPSGNVTETEEIQPAVTEPRVTEFPKRNSLKQNLPKRNK